MAIITNKIIYDGLELIFNNENNLIYSEDPLNPLNLPAKTIRVLYPDNVTPSFQYYPNKTVHVSSSPNIWDVTWNTDDWRYRFYHDANILKVLGANTTGVSNMLAMFRECTSLNYVSLFDTSNVTTVEGMFYRTIIETIPLFDTSKVTNMSAFLAFCYYLKELPLFNTDKVTNVNLAFEYCWKVETGALALYQQLSSQNKVGNNHNITFYECGKDTVTGAAELAQIPVSWKTQLNP